MRLLNFIIFTTVHGLAVSITNDKLQSMFEENVCISGAVHYLQSGPTLIKTDSDYSYSSVVDTEEIKSNSIDMDLTPPTTNYKHPSQLIHELASLNKISFKYILEDEEGPSHQKIFTIKLKLGNEEYIGKGLSLKEAKRNAALEALVGTKYIIPSMVADNKNEFVPPMVALYSLAGQNGLKVTYTFISKEEFLSGDTTIYGYSNLMYQDRKKKPPWMYYNATNLHKNQTGTHVPTGNVFENQEGFFVKLLLEDRQYYGKGLNKAMAKNDATLKALDDLENNPFEEYSEEDLAVKKESYKTPLAKLNEIKTKCGNCEFIFTEEEEGKPHERIFIAKLKYKEFEVKGTGTSKKQAKHEAAEKMLQILKENNFSFINDTGMQNKKSNKGKKNKNKKGKVIKTKFEKIQSKIEDLVSSASSYLWPTNDEIVDEGGEGNSRNKKMDNDDKGSKSYKQALIYFLASRGIEMSFLEGPQSLKPGFTTLLSVGTVPPYVCFSQGSSQLEAEEMASMAMFKNLQRLGMENVKVDSSSELKTYSNFKELLKSFHLPVEEEEIETKEVYY